MEEILDYEASVRWWVPVDEVPYFFVDLGDM